MIGIYEILNLTTNKRYIGQSRILNKRYNEHLDLLRHNKHFNNYLQHAFNKYGENDFEFEILEYCSEKELTLRENYWIDFYGGYKSSNLYNLQGGTDSYSISLEVRNKISQNNKGKHYGNNNGMYGKHHTLESRKKMSQSINNKGINNPMYGKHHTQKTKDLISSANKNKKLTDDQRFNISKGHKGLTYKRNIWTNDICLIIRCLHLMGYSYYKLAKLCHKNAETIRISIRRYEIENNLSNSSNFILLLK